MAGAAARTLALAAAACLVGCDSAEPPAEQAAQVTDSAGVELVTLSADAMAAASAAWDATESLRIGRDDARPETLFGYVADVAVDANGLIYVLDAQAQAVRVFDPDGRTVRTIGGPGDGPGEFGRFAASVLIRGDTVLVADWGQGRINRFLTGGTVLPTERVPTTGANRNWWRSTAAGLVFRSLSMSPDENGKWLSTDQLLRRVPGGAPDTLLSFEYAVSDVGGRGAPNVPVIVNAPSWTVLHDASIVWLAVEEGRLRFHDSDGALVRIVSSPAWDGVVPTQADLDAMLEKLGTKLEMLGGSRDALEQLPVESPARLPGITMVRAGPDGTIWVQRLADPGDIHPMALNAPDPPVGYGGSRWDVLDRQGRLRGHVTLPPGLRVMRITDRAVYGVAQDALDTEMVVRLDLEDPRT